MPSTVLAVDDSVTMRKVLEITFAGPEFRVVTANSPDSALQKVVAEIVAKPPLALRAAKTIVNTSLTCDNTEAALAIERGLNQWLFSSKDLKEGVAAFVEKRKPVFIGRKRRSDVDYEFTEEQKLIRDS